MQLSVVLLIAVAVAVSAAPARHFLHRGTVAPPGWKFIQRAPADHSVHFFIALPQRNLDQLDDKFNKVSDPTHVEYGQYLTHAQVLEIVAPEKALVDRVLATIPAGIACENRGDALKCNGKAVIVEELFQTQLGVFRHEESGMMLVRHFGDFSVHASIASDVAFISPLSTFILPIRRQVHVRDEAAPDATFVVVPETLTRMYNISEKGDARSSHGAAEFQSVDWPYLDSDLQTFAKNTGTTITISKTFGPATPPGETSIEASLDVQYLGAIGQGNTNWYWKEEQWMFDFVQNLEAATDRPNVLSLSYAWSEAEQCISLTDQIECTKNRLTNDQYVARINSEFQKLGTMGVTIVSASGDSGAHGRTDETCAGDPKMHPDYPACSPYVTSIGGTALTNPVSQAPTEPICKTGQVTCATGGVEVTATTQGGLALISSGGGFSWLAPRPSYQASVVSAYLSNPAAKLPPNNLFNSTNRGFPDVAGLSHYYYIEADGQLELVDGTSCSTPVWAGIIGLLNAHRIRAGRPVIGFANPLLYQIYANTKGAAFQDVTVGDNRCTEEGCSCKYGFTAIQGWDAATGLGTPNVGRIIIAMDALDEAREAKIRAAAVAAGDVVA